MKTLYKCDNEYCRYIFDSVNDSCPDCGSDEFTEIDEDDICPICGEYHDTGFLGNYKRVLENCFNEVYCDGFALEYMLTCWKKSELQSNKEWMLEPYSRHARTLKECLWTQDTDEIKRFMRFAEEFAAKERAEKARLDEVAMAAAKPVLI